MTVMTDESAKVARALIHQHNVTSEEPKLPLSAQSVVSVSLFDINRHMGATTLGCVWKHTLTHNSRLGHQH